MGESVQFPSNGKTAQGYLAHPSSPGPGVVVIQEWWGLVPHVEDVCERFAREGFVALAPDLYHGKATTEPDEAGKLMMEMQIEDASRDMAGAVDFLRAHDAVRPKKVGVTGFCMGGGLTLHLATIKDVDAAVPWYPAGQPSWEPRCPVLGHFAEHDEWATAAEELLRKWQAEGRPVEVHSYPGTSHAFFNDSRPEVYRAEAARTGWDRTLAFFRRHLG